MVYFIEKGRDMWMSIKSLFICILAGSIWFVYSANRGYGDPSEEYPGYPGWHERNIHLWSNVCRLDPTGFRDTYVGNYSILLPQNYPPVGPLYRQIDLNRAARFHADEMANDCGLQHESCDNTSARARILSYYDNSSTWGENIATSRPSALGTVIQWVMDGNPPAADDPGRLGADGHRTNIMNEDFKELGAGYAYGSQEWYHFWVQDFGGGTSAYSYHPVASGSHVFADNDSITFLATYYDPDRPPQEGMVIIAGTAHPLELHLGSEDKGVYSFSQKRNSGCRHYYFTFGDHQGGIHRYPEGGSLVTFGEGDCETDYAPLESLLTAPPTSEYRQQSARAIVRCSGKLPTLYLTQWPDVPIRGVIMTLQGDVIDNFTIEVPGGANPEVSLSHPLTGGYYCVVLSTSRGRYAQFGTVVVE
ncbi:MAG: hypothetical protein GF401_02450 [Chitinivibrionales bacterium]|nr:hypothetical protein [Chitinivibrionales bacterium]